MIQFNGQTSVIILAFPALLFSASESWTNDGDRPQSSRFERPPVIPSNKVIPYLYYNLISMSNESIKIYLNIKNNFKNTQ